MGSTQSDPATLGLPQVGLGVCAFPVYTAQASGCSIWSVPRAARGSSPPVFHKSAEQKAAPALCAFPARAAQAGRSLTGTLPSAVSLSPPRSHPQFPCVPVRCERLVSILGSWPLAVTLPVDVDYPESQEVFG